jgi:DNA-binding response OmpR family regulator
VLLVEDCPALASVLEAELVRRMDLEVRVATDGEQAVRCILEAPPDAVVLDYALPDLRGDEVCRKVRPSFSAPILLISARCDSEARCRCFASGADAYLAKPFQIAELIAALQALLRRCPPLEPVRLRIDLKARRIERDGRPLELAPQLLELLLRLAARQGEVVPRAGLHAALTGRDWDGNDRLVDQTVERLRHALGDPAGHPRLVLTRRGVGYLLASEGVEVRA